MHVLQVIDSLAPAGAERSLAAMAPHLTAAGLRLDVAWFAERAGVHADLEAAGAQLFPIPAPSRPARVRATAALVRERRPDLVHTTLFEADVAGRTAALLARVPVVSTWASVAYGAEHRSQPGVRAARLAASYSADLATARWVRRFHAVSAHVAGTMRRRLLLTAGRVDVVHRGRDPAVLGRRTADRRRRARDGLGLGAGDTAVLAVARHEHPKGLDVLLRAWPAVRAGVPGARLLVAGREGNQTADLRAVAGEGVALLGARDDVAELLCAADVFVLPSRREGLPGALLEAIALEAPVVASDIPPVREVVGPDHALLVPVGDAGALAAALTAVATDAAGAGARAERALRRFHEGFTVEAAAAGMMAFYERALAGRRRR